MFGLATTFGGEGSSITLSPEYKAFANTYSDRTDWNGKHIAFYPTVFDQLPNGVAELLVYRDWWLAGASMAQWHPDIAPLPADTKAPPA